MLNLAKRSQQTELLDGISIPVADLECNLRELAFINKWLGGHQITITGLMPFLNDYTGPLHIVEIGSGGGDNLAAIRDFLNKKKREATLTGIDLKPDCVNYARNHYPDIEFICSDYRQIVFKQAPTVIFNSLFCHHFDETAIIQLLQWMRRNATHGFFINDLHRHPLAYYSIKMLTALFSNSYLVKHDAPLSVARAYTNAEWKLMADAADLEHVTVEWKWAFRYLIRWVHEINFSSAK